MKLLGRQTDEQTDRQTDRQTDWTGLAHLGDDNTLRVTCLTTATSLWAAVADRQASRKTDRYAGVKEDKHQADKHLGEQAVRQTQTDRL